MSNSLNLVYPKEPNELSDRPPQLHIIFVHGLDGDWQTTWRHPGLPTGVPGNEIGWPLWIGEALQAEGIPVTVHSVDYPAASSRRKHPKNAPLPMFDRAGNILEAITTEPAFQNDAGFLFICHSLGGLMVKEMLSIARDESDEKSAFPSRCKGILFLGTPHQGSGLANVLNKCIPTLYGTTVTIDELERNNPQLQKLYKIFKKQAEEHNWNVFQFTEGLKTHRVQIVDRFSADSGVGGCVTEDFDHIQLPKVAQPRGNIWHRAMRMARMCRADPPPSPTPSAPNPPPLESTVRKLLLEILNEKGVL